MAKTVEAAAPVAEKRISVAVNGTSYKRTVDVRTTLADFLREELALTGTHLGCEHGVCGACTVLMDGASVRSCLLFAVQADGSELMTVEGLAGEGSELHPIQQAFWENHGLQCGFCTSGFLLAAHEFLSEYHGPTEAQVREALAGQVCRCTGYEHIVRAVMAADAAWER